MNGIMAHATAAMAGANVQHVPIDAEDYGVIQGIEYLLDAHDGPSHAASNQYWLQAIMEAASRNGSGGRADRADGQCHGLLDGNGSALLALAPGIPGHGFAVVSSCGAESLAHSEAAGIEAVADAGAASFRRFKISRAAGPGKTIPHSISTWLRDWIWMAGCGRRGTIQPSPSLLWKIFASVSSGLTFGIGHGHLVGDGGQALSFLPGSNRQPLLGGVSFAGSRRSVSPWKAKAVGC